MVLDQDEKLLPDNLEYFHNRFAGGCMNIIERSYILGTFRVKGCHQKLFRRFTSSPMRNILRIVFFE